jgi:hypothetical protein
MSINRRNLFWLLVPLCAASGAILRLTEKVQASPIAPKKFRAPPGNYYYWTDGTEVWGSGYDVPKGKQTRMHFVVDDKDLDLCEYKGSK